MSSAARVVWHECLASTNDEALAQAEAGAPHGLVVCARQQTAGRGRQQRVWISPPGNLYASQMLRLAIPVARTPEIGFVAALAVATALDTMVPGSRLKWPNDVHYAGAKVAGVLVEAAGDALVIGVGINLAHAPEGLAYPATSLAALGGNVAVEAMLAALLATTERWVAMWAADGFAPVRTAWMARGPTMGAALLACVGGRGVAGAYAGLAADGALLLEVGGGLRRVVVGDVAAG